MYFEKHSPISSHVLKQREQEAFDSITELLRKGGKVIVGNVWKNRKGGGGYFEVKILHKEQVHVFELDGCIPMIFDRVV